MKKSKKILIVIAVILLICIVGIVTWLLWPTPNGGGFEMSESEIFLFGTGNFGKNPDAFVKDNANYSSNIMTEIYNASTKKDALLAYQMYRRACLQFYTAESRAMHSVSNGGAKIMLGAKEGSAGLLLTSTNYSKKLPDSEYGSKYAIQNVSKQIGEIEGALAFLVPIILKLSEVHDCYGYDGEYDYSKEYIKNSARIENSLAVADFKSPAKAWPSKEWAEYNQAHGNSQDKGRPYNELWYDEYGLDSWDKTDHIILPELMVDGSISIQPIETEDGKYYKIKFAIDTFKEISSGLHKGKTSAYYFEQMLLDIASFPGLDIKYQKIEFTMDIWDNGYIRNWITDEMWKVTVSLGASGEISARINEYYSYDPKDNKLDKILADFKKDANIIYPK